MKGRIVAYFNITVAGCTASVPSFDSGSPT